MALRTCRSLLGIAVLCLLFLARGNGEQVSSPGGKQVLAYKLSHGSKLPLYLSWLERLDSSRVALKFARWEDNNRWSEPRTVAEGTDWFLNYADRPSVEPLPDGSLVAHWLVHNKSSVGNHGYGLRVAMSKDQGQSWKTIYQAGLQNRSDYTGFLAFLPLSDGFAAAYLAPPDQPVEGHVKTLRYVTFDRAGTVRLDQLLDVDVCTCCPTAAILIGKNPAIAYRDHRTGDIRDVSLIRKISSRWQASQFVSRDGWQIAGCPTDGPALAARGTDVAVAWFTRAHGMPKVEYTLSRDVGAHFSTPVTVSDSNPLGRVDLQLLQNGTVAVSWIERRPQAMNEFCFRVSPIKGPLGKVHVLGTTSDGHSAGFPSIRIVGSELLAVWGEGTLHTSLVHIDPLVQIESNRR